MTSTFMIDTRELRIGNLVCWKGVKISTSQMVGNALEQTTKEVFNEIKVEDIGQDGINFNIQPHEDFITYDYNSDSIYGIPLTKEWLVDKFGFEFVSGGYFINGFKVFHFSQNEYIFSGKLGFDEIPFKYVHELQNKYYYRTGAELKIN